MLSMVDILAAGGPAYHEAVESISRLLRSAPLLDPENISRYAFHLADQRDAISQKMADQLDPGTRPNLESTEAPRVRLNGEPLPIEISALLISLINHVVSLRPNYYQELVNALIKQVETGRQLSQILSAFLDLIIQIREDMWEERSKAFRHIEDILKVLEATEKDFISSISSSQSYLVKSDQDFTSVMENGLNEIGTLVTVDSGCQDLAGLCLSITNKVGNLHNCVQRKKQEDQARASALEAEKKTAEKRLLESKRDYDEFLRQSHEMMQEIETLKAVSLNDPLTEVYNRRAYDNQLPKTMAAYKNRALKTCSMVVFDIDNFREFNNTYGHLAGDRVLAYVARLTRESLRANDLIFRYGGDEFVILMPNSNLEAAMVVAEKVRRNITSVEFKLFKNSDVTVRVTVSMGVAEINPEDDASSFFSRADQAMYMSKNRGRNRVTCQS